MPAFTEANLQDKLDLAEGIPLGIARFVFGSDDLLRCLLEAENESSTPPPAKPVGPFGFSLELPHFDISAMCSAMSIDFALDELGHTLTDALLSGDDLFAKGCKVNNGVKGIFERIPRGRWKALDPDFDHHSAQAPGIQFVDIRVFKHEAVEVDGSAVAGGKFSQARLRDWYQWYVGDCLKSGRIPSRKKDELAAVVAFGEGVPRSAVRALRSELAPQEWKARGRRKGK